MEIRTNSWEVVDGQTTIETWRAQTADGTHELTVRRKRSGRFEVRARRDQGAGLRQVFCQEYDREARALQARRNLLVQVVEGRTIAELLVDESERVVERVAIRRVVEPAAHSGGVR